MFSRPLALGDALERLEAEFGGSTDFAPTINVVNMLIEENTLVAAQAGRALTQPLNCKPARLDTRALRGSH